MSKQTFDFSEALRRMRQGKKVRRFNWNPNYFIQINKNNKIYLHYYAQDSIFGESFISEGNYMFVCVPTINDDILATDWEEMEEEE